MPDEQTNAQPEPQPEPQAEPQNERLTQEELHIELIAAGFRKVRGAYRR